MPNRSQAFVHGKHSQLYDLICVAVCLMAAAEALAAPGAAVSTAPAAAAASVLFFVLKFDRHQSNLVAKTPVRRRLSRMDLIALNLKEARQEATGTGLVLIEISSALPGQVASSENLMRARNALDEFLQNNPLKVCVFYL